MRADNKTFLGIFGEITGREARRKYPDPVFFERPTPSMTADEMRAMLRRNADEMRRVIDMMESIAGPVRGSRVPKSALMHNINLLHDWRVSTNSHGGEAGRPYLWEK